MFRNMVTSLLKYDRITTTDAKAKELRRWADHIVTLAKRGDLHARRLAMSIVREKDVVHKIFEAAPERFGAINGGYTRIIKVGRRPGDAAAMTVVELVSTDAPKPSKTKKSKPVATETKTFVPETPASQTDDEKEAPAVESKPTETEAEEGTAAQAPQPSGESVDNEK